MLMPIPYLITKEDLEALIKKSEDNIQLLSKTVLDGLKPPAGAYVFFNHTSHALSRIKDIEKIIHRMLNEVRTLAILSIEEQRLMPKNWPAGIPFPNNVQEVMKKSREVNSLAQLDMESLYIFGQILLDQWSLLAIAVGNIPLKKVHPFVELVIYLEDNPKNNLQSIWEKHSTIMLWLHYQVRFYRNRFIVHANRPWQRGTTHTSLGEEYNLFTPTPPGWLDDKKLDEDIKKLLPLTPPRIRDAKEDYWEKERAGRIIEVLFEEIGSVTSKIDREKIAELFGKKGGSTPTFQIVAKNLLQFFSESLESLIKIAESNLVNIDLGKPSKTSDDMWKERDE